jgi:hypothetical protein
MSQRSRARALDRASVSNGFFYGNGRIRCVCLARRLIRVEAAAGSISGLTRGGGRKRRIVDGSTLQHIAEFCKFDVAWRCFKGLQKGSCSYSWRRWPFAGPILRVSSLRHIVVVIRYVGGCRLCQCCVRVSSESNIRA